MDSMLQAYLDETEELMQKAEECIIKLETNYSPVDVNELFRIVHTIKGSSHIVGYEDIGNLMHKIEDLLDCARNGSILFDQSIVSLCFEGMDTVNKMLQIKREPISKGDMEHLVSTSSRICESADVYIKSNKKVEEKTVIVEKGTGIISSLTCNKPKEKNKYYITFFIEDDAPMVSTILIMILKIVGDIGTLVYSSVSDEYFSGLSTGDEVKTYEIIICTDLTEVQLYKCFDIFYVEKINVVDLVPSNVKQDSVCFSVKGKQLFRTVKPGEHDLIKELKAFIELQQMLSIFIVFIDTSELTIVHESEIGELIELKQRLKANNVEMCFIANGSNSRRIINIFDSIKPLAEFSVYKTEIDAVTNMLSREEFSLKLSKVAKDVHYE